jgi:hypothetical protein
MTAEDRAWSDFSREFRAEVLPKLLSSAICLSIQSDEDGFDVKQATEIGASLLLGKPVLIVVPLGRTVPPGLRRAADVVIDDWQPGDVASQDRMLTALRQLVADR